MAAAWIIEWAIHRQDSLIKDLRPHVLPRHWRSARVLDYMRCLYWNSPLWTPYETLVRVNKRKPLGIFILEEGPRLFYGDATHLSAWHVKDLRIENGADGEMVMEWTAPPGCCYNRKTGKVESVGQPIKRKYVWRGFKNPEIGGQQD